MSPSFQWYDGFVRASRLFVDKEYVEEIKKFLSLPETETTFANKKNAVNKLLER